ncbi:GH39 family glycosyl hydrolase [Deinococcus altitudinis]|uniref:GH39 family glycosyl hydrolase n=1 Tax=Deinococcus altitudinis TaxID=468914 RepID=UPI003892974A
MNRLSGVGAAGRLLLAALTGGAVMGIGLTGAALALPGVAAPALLTVGTAGTPIVLTAVNGFNVPYDMSVAEALEEVRSVAPTSLRYPPGNVGDENDLTLAGLRSFQSTLKLSGPQAKATVETRVFATRPDAHNRPEDAAQAARDARSLGLNVAYWEVGNEPDLYSKNRGDPSWTAERYCQVFRAQRAAILQVDPAAKFAGPAVSNVEGGGADFLAAFVRGCGDVVDLLTWHEYPTSGDQIDEDALASARRVTEHLARFRALLRDPERNPLGTGRAVGVGVTEYSLSYRSDRPRHLSDMVAALWAAETTLRLAEGGADLAQYFALIGSGGHGLVDLAGVPRPALYAFQQLRFFRGEALTAGSSNPALWVHAARTDGLLTVLISNTATSPQALASAVGGYRLIGAKTFTSQTAEDEAEPLRLKLDDALTLPARSMTRLMYKAVPAG